MGRLIFFLVFVFIGYLIMMIIGPLIGPENMTALMLTCVCILGLMWLRRVWAAIRKDYEEYKRNNRR